MGVPKETEHLNCLPCVSAMLAELCASRLSYTTEEPLTIVKIHYKYGDCFVVRKLRGILGKRNASNETTV